MYHLDTVYLYFLFNIIVDMILNKFPICIEEIVVLKAKPMYLFMVFDADNCTQSNKMFETFWRWSSGSSMCNEV